MFVSAFAAGSAYDYMRSLFKNVQTFPDAGTSQNSAATSQNNALDAFYNSNSSSSSASSSTGSSSNTGSWFGSTSFSPDMFKAMLALQPGQTSSSDAVAARAQTVFKEFDSDGDGSISKTEFENAFGSNADTTKVDALFSKLDSDGSGGISQSELTSAAQTSRAHHHHGGGGGGGGVGGSDDPLSTLMAATSGATTTKTTNSDGSTTTTVKYGDGSTITMNVPAASSSNDASNGAKNQNAANANILERLLALQSQMLTQSGGGTLTNLVS